MSRPPKADPSTAVINGPAPAPAPEGTTSPAPNVVSTDPRAKVLRTGRTWSTTGGFLYFDNKGETTAEERKQMLRDPQVASGLQIRRSSVTIDGIQVTPRRVDPTNKRRVERALYWADFFWKNLAQPSFDVYGTEALLQTADWSNNAAADVYFREETRGEFKGMICLDEAVVFSPDDYIIWRDAAGRFLGLQSRWEPTKDGEATVYPADKFLFNTWRPDPNNRDGYSLADIVWLPYYKKNQSHPESLSNLAQFSSPTTVAIGPGRPNGAALAPVQMLSGKKDAMGRDLPQLDSNGQPVLLHPHESMAHGLAGFQSGGFYVIPYSSEIKLLEAQGDGRIFQTFVDGEDWQIMVAIMGTGNMTGRAKYGSNASAQTGVSTVETLSSPEKRAAANRYTRLAQTLIKLNAPENEWDLYPTVTFGDPNKPFLESLLKSIMANSPAADDAFLTAICEKLGMTPPDFERLRAEGPLPGTVSGGGAAPGGVGGNPQGGNA